MEVGVAVIWLVAFQCRGKTTNYICGISVHSGGRDIARGRERKCKGGWWCGVRKGGEGGNMVGGHGWTGRRVADVVRVRNICGSASRPGSPAWEVSGAERR